MGTKKEQDKIRSIREYIMASGFPAEIEVGNILRKKKWIVVNQSPYVDESSQKIRTIDVLASKLGLEPPVLGFQLIIECKKSKKHPWVFHTQHKEQDFLPAFVTILELLKCVAQPPLLNRLKGLKIDYNIKQNLGRESEDLKSFNNLTNLHTLDTKIRIGILNVIPSKKDKDDFFEATQQIISAMKSHKTKVANSFVIFPVIVFDGEMYEFYEEDNEMKVFPINHLQYLSYYEGVIPCIMDVVRKKHFQEFINVIETDFEIYNELLSNSRKTH